MNSTNEFTNSIGMRFLYMPPGKFLMGSPEGEADRNDDETLHEVTITMGFYIQETPVTQGQWQSLVGYNPSEFCEYTDEHPVEQVTWEECVDFANRLKSQEKGRIYRLPTEAEWEYACRAGTTGRYCFGDDEAMLDEYGWFQDNADGHTHPVASKKPNPRGLYDMHGNVWEWCRDTFGDYPEGPATDPLGALQGAYRTGRGGAWSDPAKACRSAYRSGSAPTNSGSDMGFRLACVIPLVY
jgi:formylglycine-generating enzyme required for sulfatase activity